MGINILFEVFNSH